MLKILFSAAILLMGGLGFTETALFGRFVIHTDGGRIGGLSAVHIGDDGSTIIAVSDRGMLMQGTISRDAEGQISGIAMGTPVSIENADLPGGLTNNDSEGIAVAPDGTIYVSFEGQHRVGKFANFGAAEQTLPVPREFEALQDNSSLEALAIDADGALYTIPERSGRYDRPFPVYRYKDGKWDQPYAIPRTGAYLMVGADFGPDGMLYVLERDFSGFGFYTRVRRLDLDAATAETILETGIGVHGNMEGISVWQTADSQVIMTLIADNNFRSILTNEIAEYRIDG
ncbi:esterase-like activity of phytase family protein [Loktanella sp. F6476L]|uniref:esterase-like activity of phytase family protein n=1 Tax=Loktanella sp. F6476L TaxID=2926405 RepID=UPI001FF39F66|nr:esterase-like activity of phytase family protein [Loktanella sp. F6476L]MCK0120504.1 esterase-like activity of phytase family protein [Loktanella sp. F6476L]